MCGTRKEQAPWPIFADFLFLHLRKGGCSWRRGEGEENSPYFCIPLGASHLASQSGIEANWVENQRTWGLVTLGYSGSSEDQSLISSETPFPPGKWDSPRWTLRAFSAPGNQDSPKSPAGQTSLPRSSPGRGLGTLSNCLIPCAPMHVDGSKTAVHCRISWQNNFNIRKKPTCLTLLLGDFKFSATRKQLSVGVISSVSESPEGPA